MYLTEEPIHIETGNIAELVLLPGDPLRAKYIAENFLEDARLVTGIRAMYGYTGFYKGVKVTVMGSGMGMPSAGIYTFELIHYFHAKKIIRIGTCGGLSESVPLGGIILADKVYSESNFAYTFNDYKEHTVLPSMDLNHDILNTAQEKNIKINYGMLTTMDVFGPYIDFERVLSRIPKEYNILGEEMEAFGVIHIANSLGCKASVMATVVDSKYTREILSNEEREKNLNDMITIALDAIIK